MRKTAHPGSYRVLYGTNRDKLNRKRDPVSTTLSKDNTSWVLLESLSPNTHYYCTLVADL